MWQMWLIIAGVCFIIEILTTGFLMFWFSIGALITALVSIFTDNLIVQTSVFIVSSTALIFATKPFVKKFANNQNSVKTNAFSIIGKTAIVTDNINSLEATGQIKVGGEVWSAASFQENLNIEKGTEVEILDIQGVKAIVSPIRKIS